MLHAQSPTWLLAATALDTEVAAIRFGDEGQLWRMMTFDAFIGHAEAIPHLRQRLGDYLADRRRS